MTNKKSIFVINGSASRQSSNEQLIGYIARQMQDDFSFQVVHDLKSLPHFDPEASTNNPPAIISAFRERIQQADGVIICTPEYVFSIPAGLKNAIEWCVATTVFSDKPTGLITALASGQKGHEALQLIMQTLMARFTDQTTLLIQGVKGKINAAGEITDGQTLQDVTGFMEAYQGLMGLSGH